MSEWGGRDLPKRAAVLLDEGRGVGEWGGRDLPKCAAVRLDEGRGVSEWRGETRPSVLQFDSTRAGG